jgi:TM2 domain-containing membrane protein YozV/RNA polymerase subunit RPABC4/transcription elongation factor Spt4
MSEELQPTPKGPNEKYCFSCGAAILKAAEICPKCGVNQSKRAQSAMTEVHCPSCGQKILKAAEICPKCGVRQTGGELGNSSGDVSGDWLTLLLLEIFLGSFGGHQFYAGNAGKGVLYLLLSLVGWATSWLLIGFIPLLVVFIFWIMDLIKILQEQFQNADGRVYYKTGLR